MNVKNSNKQDLSNNELLCLSWIRPAIVVSTCRKAQSSTLRQNTRLHVNFSFSVTACKGVDPGGGRSWPPENTQEGQCMFWTAGNVPFFHSKLLWNISASLRDERLVSKMEGKTNFSRLMQDVRNRDCWVFGNHWRRVKSETVWWLDLTDPDPRILPQICSTKRVYTAIVSNTVAAAETSSP